jgi:periplasmic protein TonB
MRVYLFCGAILCATLVATTGAAAAQGGRSVSRDIVVVGDQESVDHWKGRVGRELADNLVAPRQIGMQDYPDGVVRVRFHSSETGAPDGVAVSGSSRSVALDRAAVRAVKRIPTLHPLPDGVAHDRMMEAWVIFASSDAQADRMKRGLEREVRIARAMSTDQRAAAVTPIVVASR